MLPSAKATTTNASQPKTAVFQWSALQRPMRAARLFERLSGDIRDLLAVGWWQENRAGPGPRRCGGQVSTGAAGRTRRRRSVPEEGQLGIEREAACRDRTDGSGELGDVGDPVLEQVADAFGAPIQELARVGRLDVLREDEDADARMPAADLLRGAQALVRVGRRHADVDDRDVGGVEGHVAQQVVGRARLRCNLEARVLEQAADALAKQDGVVGKDDAGPWAARRGL